MYYLFHVICQDSCDSKIIHKNFLTREYSLVSIRHFIQYVEACHAEFSMQDQEYFIWVSSNKYYLPNRVPYGSTKYEFTVEDKTMDDLYKMISPINPTIASLTCLKILHVNNDRKSKIAKSYDSPIINCPATLNNLYSSAKL